MGTGSPGTIQRTRHMLMSALGRLLEKKRFHKITVNDICSEAMVSRSAFYVHFADKYELLSAALEESMRRRKAQTQGLSLEGQMLELLEEIQENRQVLRHLFEDNLSREMMDIFMKMIDRPIRERVEEMERAGVRLPGPAATVAAFYAGGLACVILRWVQEDFRTPREEVARCQGELFSELFHKYWGGNEDV